MSDIMYESPGRYRIFYTNLTGIVDVEYFFEEQNMFGDWESKNKSISMSALSFSALIDEFFIYKDEMKEFVFKDIIKIADKLKMLPFPIYELVPCTQNSLMLPILKSIDDGIIVDEDICFSMNASCDVKVRCRNINSIYLLYNSIIVNETINGEVYDVIINLDNLCFCRNTKVDE